MNTNYIWRQCEMTWIQNKSIKRIMWIWNRCFDDRTKEKFFPSEKKFFSSLSPPTKQKALNVEIDFFNCAFLSREMQDGWRMNSLVISLLYFLFKKLSKSFPYIRIDKQNHFSTRNNFYLPERMWKRKFSSYERKKFYH
jgi:hypothetical protein